MKKKRKWLKWVILLVIAAGAAFLWVSMSETSEAVAYREMQSTAGDMITYYNFDGVVRAKHSQTITAQAADTVKTVYVERNAQVEKGDRLYRTDGGTTVRADMDGEITRYEVVGEDILNPTDVEEMTAGVFDLTLFTCTYGGEYRVTVYCDKVDS